MFNISDTGRRNTVNFDRKIRGTGVVSKIQELGELRRICPPVPGKKLVLGGKFVAISLTPGFSIRPPFLLSCDQSKASQSMRWDGWRGQLEQLLGGADGGGSRARHAEHARLGLETAFREDARALRARLHPFGRSRLELGYRGSGTR